MIKVLEDGLRAVNIKYNDCIISTLMAYMDMVLKWNEHVNLTAITDPKEFVVKHFLDSVICTTWDEMQSSAKVIDVGTGVGFPGIPLAILLPEKEFLLIDSLRKRINILTEIVDTLGLSNVKLVHGRAEDVARDAVVRESFDICVSRAVADMRVLAEYCLPFIRVGGYFLAYKGSDVNSELLAADKAISLLGGRVEEIREASLKQHDINHNIVIIKKIRNTPKKFPRQAGTPRKQPI